MRVGPGATLGIVGGGQLARMMAFEAKRMGYRVAILDPDPAAPAVSVADLHISGKLDDDAAALRLANACEVVTLDTEHVPAAVLERIAHHTLVRPSPRTMGIVQDRLSQREFLSATGIPQPRTHSVSQPDDLTTVGAAVGFPFILKARRAGYDGRGQARVDSEAAVERAWASLGKVPCIAEEFVDFSREVSVLLARDVHGASSFFPIAENLHKNGVLHTTRVPARLAADVAVEAQALGERIALALDYVGVMAVEMFVTRQGSLWVNEIAPRPHNSAHFTFGACVTSQFEQHVRAVCGMTLGDPTLLSPVFMVNFLGDLWRDGPPDWSKVLRHPGVRLHLYGKEHASPARKMGHALVLDPDIERAARIAGQLAGELLSTTAHSPSRT
jgi:5-(carboxyamino)imidazole ribonucleotide synthase